MINRENLMGMRSWAGFCGVIFIILGAFNALGGVFLFLVGAIPGILMILMGVKLRNAKSQIDLLQMQPQGADLSANLNAIFYEIRGYLQMQGVLFILSLVFMVLGILFAIFVGFGALTFMHNFNWQ